MNFQQLEYIIAVDNLRHFVQAADQCCVTQPTLSMMIKKLEEELNVKIFDRNKQPIVPTEIGAQIIEQARITLKEASRIQEMARGFNGSMSGDLRIGIIPTVSPYVLPILVPSFTKKYPEINLHVSEMVTSRSTTELKNGNIDAAIVATSPQESPFHETTLYREEFYVFLSEDNGLYDKQYIVPEDITGDQLWLLEEGHCLSDQIRKFCEIRKSQISRLFTFRSGSIETLIRMVEKNGGITILPKLAALELPSDKKKFLRTFADPAPFRDVRLVTNRSEVKGRLVQALHKEITELISPLLTQDLPLRG
jgi:LysR family hydrogen peroxide-inducible transcriptional activator